MSKKPQQMVNNPYFLSRLRDVELRLAGLEAQFGRFGEALNYIFETMYRHEERLTALEPKPEPAPESEPAALSQSPVEDKGDPVAA